MGGRFFPPFTESILDIQALLCYNIDVKSAFQRRCTLEEPAGGTAQGAGDHPGGTGRHSGGLPADISSLEKGRYNPSILLAFKIARCFGQSIEEIFLYEEDAQ